MNCGRSSSVEWKLPKLQRRVRFPSPAPPPPGCAPGGFVMPPRQARLACRTHFGRPNRYKTLPTHAPGRRYRYKTLPARARTPIVAHFQHAGRTLYRSHHQQVEQGELCTAFTTHTTSRENFVPHAGPMPVQNSPRSQPSRVEPVQNSPGSRQNAHCGPFSAWRENFIPHAGPMPVQNSPRSQPSRVEPVQNSPRSQPSRVEPVQNSPRTPKMAHFSTYYASRENFIPLSPPTRRAGRKKSRTNTPPHPPTRPSPNFACNSIA